MAGSVRIDVNLDRTVRALKRLGGPEIESRMERALTESGKSLLTDVAQESEKKLPRRYAAILIKALVLVKKIVRGGGQVKLSLNVGANGSRENRDLVRINKGVLRHPIPAGRKHPWINQRVEPGIVDKPTERMRKRVDIEMSKVADGIVRDVTGE